MVAQSAAAISSQLTLEANPLLFPSQQSLHVAYFVLQFLDLGFELSLFLLLLHILKQRTQRSLGLVVLEVAADWELLVTDLDAGSFEESLFEFLSCFLVLILVEMTQLLRILYFQDFHD